MGNTFLTLGGRVLCTQCKAMSKRTRLRCRAPAIKGKAVCRFHGGKSTGPKTKAGRAIMRIEGKRYERTLVRIKTGPIVEGVTAEFTRKYGVEMTPAEVEAEELWLFEMAPPDANINGDSG